MTTTVGIDIGSGAVKTVLFDGEKWLAKRVERIRRRDPMELAKQGYDEVLEEAELAGIDAVHNALARAYEDVKDLGKGIGETLVGAFQSAEEAVGEFVKTGKLDVKSLSAR